MNSEMTLGVGPEFGVRYIGFILAASSTGSVYAPVADLQRCPGVGSAGRRREHACHCK